MKSINEKQVNCEEDYRKLRGFSAKEYFHLGRILAPDPELIPDQWGTSTSHYYYFCEDQIVAVFALRDVPKDDELACLLPDEIRGDCIEVYNLIIQAPFRGGDLARRIYERVHMELVARRKTHILTTCVEGLVPYYKRIQFGETGHFVHRKYGKRERLNVMISCQWKGGYGLHVGPLRWNLYLGRLYPRMKALYPHDQRARTLLALYRLFAPVSFILVQYYRWKQWTKYSKGR